MIDHITDNCSNDNVQEVIQLVAQLQQQNRIHTESNPNNYFREVSPNNDSNTNINNKPPSSRSLLEQNYDLMGSGSLHTNNIDRESMRVKDATPTNAQYFDIQSFDGSCNQIQPRQYVQRKVYRRNQNTIIEKSRMERRNSIREKCSQIQVDLDDLSTYSNVPYNFGAANAQSQSQSQQQTASSQIPSQQQ